jgi:UDP-N-acetylmuramate: L-alanyl-gamma-D-glutamyl-meso-diaminopimelate ligase
VPGNFNVTARLGEGQHFVVEADEYDTAFFDKRAKFVHYRPRTAILNNLEHDHADIYPDVAAIQWQFHQLIRMVPRKGQIVANVGEPNIVRTLVLNNLEYDHADIFPDLAAIETQFHHLLRTVPRMGRIVVNGSDDALARVVARGVWSEVERFGVADSPGNGPGWTIGVDGDILLGGAAQGRLDFGMSGRHNQLNALAAIAAARHAGVPVALGLDALRDFKGIRRRMEVRGTVRGVTVYDDFAHHPTAITTTLDGLRRNVDSARIIAVLEPRSNTMKLGTMKAQLPASVAAADRVYCYAGNLGWDAGEVFAPLGAKAAVIDDLDVLVDAIARDAHAGDHVVVMSNGSFGGIHDKLLRRLAAAA